MQFDGQLGAETESSDTWSADCMNVIGCFSGSMTSCKNLRYTAEVRACVRAWSLVASGSRALNRLDVHGSTRVSANRVQIARMFRYRMHAHAGSGRHPTAHYTLSCQHTARAQPPYCSAVERYKTKGEFTSRAASTIKGIYEHVYLSKHGQPADRQKDRYIQIKTALTYR